jgi:hypothetical protein
MSTQRSRRSCDQSRRSRDLALLVLAMFPVWWLTPLPATWAQATTAVEPTPLGAAAAIGAVSLLLAAFIGLLGFVMWRERRASRRQRRKLAAARGI